MMKYVLLLSLFSLILDKEIINGIIDTYKYLEKHQSETKKLIHWHFKLVLTSLRRKITLRQKYRDPYTITVSTLVHPEVYYQAFRAVRDFDAKIGFTATTERTAKGKAKLHILKFDRLGVFKYHFKKLSDVKNIGYYCKKEFKRGETGTLEVSADKPAVVTYKISTGTLTLQCSYVCTNSFGHVVSF